MPKKNFVDDLFEIKYQSSCGFNFLVPPASYQFPASAPRVLIQAASLPPPWSPPPLRTPSSPLPPETNHPPPLYPLVPPFSTPPSPRSPPIPFPPLYYYILLWRSRSLFFRANILIVFCFFLFLQTSKVAAFQCVFCLVSWFPPPTIQALIFLLHFQRLHNRPPPFPSFHLPEPKFHLSISSINFKLIFTNIKNQPHCNKTGSLRGRTYRAFKRLYYFQFSMNI